MNKILISTVTAIMLLGAAASADSAIGSAFGTMTTARAEGMGNGNALFGIGFGDDRNVFMGRINYGLSRFTTGSIKLGLVDMDGPSDTKVAFGADIMYQFMVMDNVSRSAFEMAAGGMMEYYDFDFGSALLIGGAMVGSYPFVMDNGRQLTPYARFNARIERLSFDAGPFVGSSSDSNLEFGLNLGVCWEVTSTFNLYGELQADGNDGLFLGAEFDIF